MTTKDWLDLLVVLYPILILPALGAIGGWLVHQYGRLPPQQQKVIAQAANRAVLAVEQMYRSGQLRNRFDMAEDALLVELARYGITPTREEVKAALEAAVLEMKPLLQQIGEPAPTTAPLSHTGG